MDHCPLLIYLCVMLLVYQHMSAQRVLMPGKIPNCQNVSILVDLLTFCQQLFLKCFRDFYEVRKQKWVFTLQIASTVYKWKVNQMGFWL